MYSNDGHILSLNYFICEKDHSKLPIPTAESSQQGVKEKSFSNIVTRIMNRVAKAISVTQQKGRIIMSKDMVKLPVHVQTCTLSAIHLSDIPQYVPLNPEAVLSFTVKEESTGKRVLTCRSPHEQLDQCIGRYPNGRQFTYEVTWDPMLQRSILQHDVNKIHKPMAIATTGSSACAVSLPPVACAAVDCDSLSPELVNTIETYI